MFKNDEEKNAHKWNKYLNNIVVNQIRMEGQELRIIKKEMKTMPPPVVVYDKT